MGKGAADEELFRQREKQVASPEAGMNLAHRKKNKVASVAGSRGKGGVCCEMEQSSDGLQAPVMILSKCSGKPLGAFKQENNVVQFLL